jgi:hypothetical protein
MDSYIQIICRFQKCKQKVPPPLLLSNEKSPFNPPKEDFSLMRSNNGRIYIKFEYKNPLILTPCDWVDVST